MSKQVSKLNNQKSAVIDKNFLEQNPEDFEHANSRVVLADAVPEFKEVIFQNGRDPGVALTFHYASKTHPLHHYTLYHGHKHNLPVEIINHLESCAESQYGYRKKVDGTPEMYTSGYKYIFSFRNSK